MDRKEKLELIKLTEEIKILRQQLSKSARRVESLKGMVGIITAFVAMMGLFSSIWRYQAVEEAKSRADTLQQVNHYIGLLADDNSAKNSQPSHH